MPHTVPSQLIGCQGKWFRGLDNFRYSMTESHIGIVAGFRELYDQLPSGLIRLPEDDFAEDRAEVSQ
jgi:hypothetical protein